MRAILHSDLNSFYASVEMMLDPKLRGKAVAVCGSTEERHGIVLAKSELAKRSGVKTGMANWPVWVSTQRKAFGISAKIASHSIAPSPSFTAPDACGIC